jgi:hypothetical protein
VARWLRSRLPTRCWTAFTFYMRFPLGGGSTLTFRGEVYAWDGAKPTGPNLWESAALTVTLSSSSKPLPSTRAEYHSSPASDTSCSEHLQGLRTERQDYEQNASGNVSCWGWIQTDVYDGGRLVFLAESARLRAHRGGGGGGRV